MLKYRQPRLIRAGIIGVVLGMLCIAIGLHPAQLVALATAVRYHAEFVDAAGLADGDDVTVSGIKVGTVSDIDLRHGRALVTFNVDGTVRLRSDTTAHIRTGTLLGKRVLALQPAGGGAMHPSGTIPLSRTSSPYSLTDAVGELTTNVAGTDTRALDHALDTLATTVDQISPQLRPSLDSLTRLSKALNERDTTLGDLLHNTGKVTAILSQRSQRLNALLLNSNDLLGVLVERRQAIVNLLANVAAVARQLKALVQENEPKLAPTLKRLNAVAAMLEENRDNIAKALPGLAKFEGTLGEAVSSGYYYQANLGNLLPGPMLQPFLDYAVGLRRGTQPGHPPGNPGPRAEFPLPYNGIPLTPNGGGG